VVSCQYTVASPDRLPPASLRILSWNSSLTYRLGPDASCRLIGPLGAVLYLNCRCPGLRRSCREHRRIYYVFARRDWPIMIRGTRGMDRGLMASEATNESGAARGRAASDNARYITGTSVLAQVCGGSRPEPRELRSTTDRRCRREHCPLLNPRRSRPAATPCRYRLTSLDSIRCKASYIVAE
jgi:hypothetical protein